METASRSSLTHWLIKGLICGSGNPWASGRECFGEHWGVVRDMLQGASSGAWSGQAGAAPPSLCSLRHHFQADESKENGLGCKRGSLEMPPH